MRLAGYCARIIVCTYIPNEDRIPWWREATLKNPVAMENPDLSIILRMVMRARQGENGVDRNPVEAERDWRKVRKGEEVLGVSSSNPTRASTRRRSGEEREVREREYIGWKYLELERSYLVPTLAVWPLTPVGGNAAPNKTEVII